MICQGLKEEHYTCRILVLPVVTPFHRMSGTLTYPDPEPMADLSSCPMPTSPPALPPIDFSRSHIFWSMRPEQLSDSQIHVPGGNAIHASIAAVLDIKVPTNNKNRTTQRLRYVLVRQHIQEHVFQPPGSGIFQAPNAKYEVIFEEHGLVEQSVNLELASSDRHRERQTQSYEYSEFKSNVYALDRAAHCKTADQVTETQMPLSGMSSFSDPWGNQFTVRYPVNVVNFAGENFQVNTGPIVVPLFQPEDIAFWSNFQLNKTSRARAIGHLGLGYIAWNSLGQDRVEILPHTHRRSIVFQDVFGHELPPLWSIPTYDIPENFCANNWLFGQARDPDVADTGSDA